MNNKLKIAILSISLFPIMAGATLAPALGAISEHFSDAPKILISLIVALPSLLIAITSLFGGAILRKLSIKHAVVMSILLYLFGGVGGAFSNNIYILLAFRSIIGIATGMIIPFSVTLIAYFSKPDETKRLMGYSSALYNLGGVIGFISCGFLLKISWRMPFFIYSLALIPLVLVLINLPNIMLEKPKQKTNLKTFKPILPYSTSLFIGSVVVYAFVTNFSFLIVGKNIFPLHLIGIVMSCGTVIAFFSGLFFSEIITVFKEKTKYLVAFALLISMTIFAIGNTLLTMVIAACVSGIGIGLITPLINSKISHIMTKENVATGMSINSVFMGLGNFISPVIISGLQFLNYSESPSFPFYVGGVISIILILVFSRQKLLNE